MKTVIVAAAFLLLPTPAGAYSCETVRWAYRAYGEAQLMKWARQYRVTPAQMRAARACLRGKR